MSYEITVDDAHGIVQIRFHKMALHRDHLKARDELLEICSTRGISKILIDVRDLEIQNEPSTMELYDFADSWAEMGKGMSFRLAGVLPKDSKTRNEVQFVDNVAFNRGLVARRFDEIDKAREWLREL